MCVMQFEGRRKAHVIQINSVFIKEIEHFLGDLKKIY